MSVFFGRGNFRGMRENLRHKIRTQEHVCHICGFTTMSKLHIKRHILVKHQSDKHKKCPHCDFHTGYSLSETLVFASIKVHIF